MYTVVNVDSWNRKEHYHFYRQFSQPFFGVTMEVDCTSYYLRSKDEKATFFQLYLHAVMSCINEVEELKYRIVDGELRCYDKVNVSSTVFREDKTFGFSFIEFNPDLLRFIDNVIVEFDRVKNTTGLFTSSETGRVDSIHFSALPWVNFTSVDHAFHIGSGDSCPKVSVGKMKMSGDKYFIPISLHAHHACADGYHVALFFDLLQKKLNE